MSDKSKLDWPSFLAGWDAASERYAGTGKAWSQKRLERDYNEAAEEFERALRAAPTGERD